MSYELTIETVKNFVTKIETLKICLKLSTLYLDI